MHWPRINDFDFYLYMADIIDTHRELCKDEEEIESKLKAHSDFLALVGRRNEKDVFEIALASLKHQKDSYKRQSPGTKSPAEWLDLKKLEIYPPGILSDDSSKSDKDKFRNLCERVKQIRELLAKVNPPSDHLPAYLENLYSKALVRLNRELESCTDQKSREHAACLLAAPVAIGRQFVVSYDGGLSDCEYNEYGEFIWKLAIDNKWNEDAQTALKVISDIASLQETIFPSHFSPCAVLTIGKRSAKTEDHVYLQHMKRFFEFGRHLIELGQVSTKLAQLGEKDKFTPISIDETPTEKKERVRREKKNSQKDQARATKLRLKRENDKIMFEWIKKEYNKDSSTIDGVIEDWLTKYSKEYPNKTDEEKRLVGQSIKRNYYRFFSKK